VTACQDVSDGGMIVAAAEMAMAALEARGLGLYLDITAAAGDLRPDRALFSESSGFVVEVPAGREADFEALCRARGVEPMRIGEVTAQPTLRVSVGGEALAAPVAELADAYRNALPALFAE
jgi:phosphoribosylformylglycinamidine synthase